ncbi:MAG: phosphoglycerate kinase [Candidatus Micrarchaeota archaeon]|nr:phosphoglycerate kinase [Candidatus Micrarchaeota archaeon]
MRKISEINVKGKKLIVRVDLNSPIEGGEIQVNPRMHAHAATIAKLSNAGAKVIVIAHQGRRGDDDFTHLHRHTELLKEITGKHQMSFIDDVIGEKAKSALATMKDGDIVILDNVRMLNDETKEKCNGQIVKELTPLADYFVLDALSIAHRGHASVVGFAEVLPSFMGYVLAAEVSAIEKVKNSKNVTFFFGGSKVEESFDILRHWLNEEKVNKVLVGGALSILLIYSAGYGVADSYEFLEEGGLLKFVDEAREILNKFADKIVLPIDFGISIGEERREVDFDKVTHGQIFDIGEKTIANYAKIISEAQTIVANGPAGVYELEKFGKGTKGILSAIANSKGFSLLGGGHTITAIEKFKLPKEKFGYVSLSGKALIEYLSGKEIAGLKALEESEKKFKV